MQRRHQETVSSSQLPPASFVLFSFCFVFSLISVSASQESFTGTGCQENTHTALSLAHPSVLDFLFFSFFVAVVVVVVVNTV